MMTHLQKRRFKLTTINRCRTKLADHNTRRTIRDSHGVAHAATRGKHQPERSNDAS
jgi:hypothetical protein